MEGAKSHDEQNVARVPSPKRDSASAIADVIGALMAERDHYREALERIYQTGKGVHVEIAREALNRG